jgi:hypothetical protein
MAALMTAGAASLLSPPAVAAVGSDQLQDNAVVTYQLDASRHVIHVSVRMAMTNKAPSTSSRRACTGWAFDPYYGWYSYQTTCVYRTNYYYNSSTVWIEADATHLRVVSAGGGTASIKAGSKNGDWRQITIKYSPLYYGRSRVITYAYDLPASGPRGTTTRRAGAATATFCATGPGSDSGEVRIVLPAGYLITRTSALNLISRGGGLWTWTSGRLASKPWTWQSCIDGTNPNGSTSIPAAPGGPISTVSAWKDDPTWAAAAKTASTDAAKLEAVLGTPPGGDGITLVEVAAGLGGRYDSSSKQLRLNEFTTDPLGIDDAIAGIWFPDTVFADGWIRTGTIAWAEAQAGIVSLCTEPGSPPSPSAAKLDPWAGWTATYSHKPANDVAAYQINAACWLVSQVAAAIGPDRMQTVLAAMRDGKAGWSASDERNSRTLRWQDWLDIVTAKGLIPAGADPELAADLLTTNGIAKPEDHLDARSKAVKGYLAFQTTTDGHVPASILPAIAGWDFTAANHALDTANHAWSTVAGVPELIPAVTIADGPVRQAVRSATTQADLDAASSLADTQAAIAKHVADALAAETAPRDLVEQVGLVGTTLPSDSVAVSAVASVDAPTANATADQIMGTLAGAKNVGIQRIEAAAAVLVGLVVLVVVAAFLVRRRRRTMPAVAVAESAVDVPATTFATSVTPVDAATEPLPLAAPTDAATADEDPPAAPV